MHPELASSVTTTRRRNTEWTTIAACNFSNDVFQYCTNRILNDKTTFMQSISSKDFYTFYNDVHAAKLFAQVSYAGVRMPLLSLFTRMRY